MHNVKAKGIITNNHGFHGMNIYRGCTHGCIYCDSRSKCYQMKHLFEDVEVKINAPELLKETLRNKRKKCMIGTGSMSDPYMHLEKELRLTRKCLEIIYEYGFGVTVLTKSDMILDDIELLGKINDKTKCVVQMTLTTYDEDLCRIIEPNVASTERRIAVLKKMQEYGIPTVVWLTPVLPFINDNEDNIRKILNACVDAKVKGIVIFGMGLTLRDGNREYFYNALDKYFPGLKDQYIRYYGQAYNIRSPKEKELMKVLKDICEKNHIMYKYDEVFAYLNDFPENYEQIRLF